MDQSGKGLEVSGAKDSQGDSERGDSSVGFRVNPAPGTPSPLPPLLPIPFRARPSPDQTSGKLSLRLSFHFLSLMETLSRCIPSVFAL